MMHHGMILTGSHIAICLPEGTHIAICLPVSPTLASLLKALHPRTDLLSSFIVLSAYLSVLSLFAVNITGLGKYY